MGAGDLLPDDSLPVFLVSPALLQTGETINAAIAEEGPDATEIFDHLEIAFYDADLFFRGAGFGNDLAVGVRDKGSPPEEDVAFLSHAIHGRDVATVGHGVSALHGLPRVVLGGA
jgi:hypothetical protein